jgi:hypothetical protein
LIPSLALLLCLAACQRGGTHDADAVRQGVIDHLAKAKYNVDGMDVKVNDVQYSTAGDQADATVSITAKGQSGAPAMSFKYHMLHQDNKWVVEGPPRDTGGTNPHGGAMPGAAGGAENPHGGAMPGAAPGAGQMPAPGYLPPATKK